MNLLNLDLQHTTIEDFVQHVRITLFNGVPLMESAEDTIICFAKHNPYPKMDCPEPVIQLHSAEVTSVHHYFQVKYIDESRVKEALSLEIIRYQTNVLRVLLTLSLDQPDPDRDTATFAKNTLLDWLRPRWGDAVIELPLEDAPVEQVPPIFERPLVYGDSDTRTTIANFLMTTMKYTQRLACDLVGVADGTYRNHRNQGKFLSEEDFRQRNGISIEMAAKNC